MPNIRNLVVHSYYPVNDPILVEKCFALARHSLADFKATWAAQAHSEQSSAVAQIEPPSWEVIKEAFQLSFLPEQNQLLTA